MSTSKIIALVLMIVAVVLLLAAGLDIVESTKYDLVALSLASFISGVIIKDYVP